MIFMIIILIAGLGILIFSLVMFICLPMVWCALLAAEEPEDEANQSYYVAAIRGAIFPKNEPVAQFVSGDDQKKEEAPADGEKKDEKTEEGPKEGEDAKKDDAAQEGGDEEESPMIKKRK